MAQTSLGIEKREESFSVSVCAPLIPLLYSHFCEVHIPSLHNSESEKGQIGQHKYAAGRKNLFHFVVEISW